MTRSFPGALLVAASLTLLSLFTPAGGSLAAPATTASPPGRLDLAAAMPTTADLEDGGLTGFVATLTYDETLDDLMFLVEDDPQDSGTLSEAGFVNGFTKYWEPADEANDVDEPGMASTMLVATTYEFATDDGASDALALLGEDAEEIADPDFSVGDESHLSAGVLDAGTLGPEEGALQVFDLTIRTGRLAAVLELFVSSDSPERGSEIEVLQAVGTAMADRMDAVEAGDAPGLSVITPIYTDPAGMVIFADYLYRDGRLTDPYPGETEDSVATRLAQYQESGVDAVYRVVQPIASDETEDAAIYTVSETVWSFERNRDAAQWVEAREDSVAALDGIEDVDAIEIDAAELAPGVGTVGAFTYRQDFGDGEPLFKTQVNVQVGSLGVSVYIESPVEHPSPDAALAVANLIAGCVDEGSCDPQAEVPAAVVENREELIGAVLDRNVALGRHDDSSMVATL